MTKVGELMPGNVVCVDFERATFITQTQHPLWPNLQLVIWKVEGDLRTWSLDALSIGQDIGEVEPSTPDSRFANLRAALLGRRTHPESTCNRCGGPNVVWVAPSPLWNEVMRAGEIGNADRFDGIVCPTCFALLAQEAGVAERWRFNAERVNVKLTTVTPSGRVWNEKTWLWEEAVT